MLEKPAIEDAKISACLQANYGLNNAQVEFLPIGADQNTAVYRALAKDGKSYFLKLRSGVFNETSVTLPRFLSEQGISQVIAPLLTRTSQPWGSLEKYKTILYP